MPTTSDSTLASGLEPSELGLRLTNDCAIVPARRVRIESEDAARLAASLPHGVRPPDDRWKGPMVLRPASIVVSYGTLSLNTQIVALLRAAEAEEARCLVVMAPRVTDEALATLLVNDAAKALPGRIVPLELCVPEAHAGETSDAIAAWLGVAACDGRPRSVALTRVTFLEVRGDRAVVWKVQPALPRRLWAALLRG